MTKPIFILSLPRSGSTMLQRILLGTNQCATLGEPSILLRFLDNEPHTQRLAPYWESLLSHAYNDIRTEWPEFDITYRKGIHDLALSIYSGLAKDKPFFIDKTPRYTLIAEQIIETFPEAKIIVLWRHPGAIADSLARAYRKGKWALKEFEIDLFSGLDNLHQFSQKHKAQIFQLRYEDLTTDPESTLLQLGQYIGLPNLQEVAQAELPKSAGGQKLGDQTGRKQYSQITSETNDRWIQSVDNWYRRKWLRRIFTDERSAWLAQLGYTLPDQTISGKCNSAKGLNECLTQMRRSIKRSSNPKSRKLEKHYSKRMGHSISYR